MQEENWPVAIKQKHFFYRNFNIQDDFKKSKSFPPLFYNFGILSEKLNYGITILSIDENNFWHVLLNNFRTLWLTKIVMPFIWVSQTICLKISIYFFKRCRKTCSILVWVQFPLNFFIFMGCCWQINTTQNVTPLLNRNASSQVMSFHKSLYTGQWSCWIYSPA